MHRRLNVSDAFPRSADEHAEQVVQLLRHRRADMDAAWEELEEGWKAIYGRMVEVGLSSRTSNEGTIRLNVGGSNVTVFCHLLAEAEGSEDSILGALFEGVWGKERIPLDADGRIVIDESPACVKHIIHTMLRDSSSGRSSSAERGVSKNAARSAVANDEVQCLIYTGSVMGLPGSMLTHHPNYVNVNGGSTIFIEAV
ncbi:unnamed protein product [Laminaria digitata]